MPLYRPQPRPGNRPSPMAYHCPQFLTGSSRSSRLPPAPAGARSARRRGRRPTVGRPEVAPPPAMRAQVRPKDGTERASRPRAPGDGRAAVECGTVSAARAPKARRGATVPREPFAVAAAHHHTSGLPLPDDAMRSSLRSDRLRSAGLGDGVCASKLPGDRERSERTTGGLLSRKSPPRAVAVAVAFLFAPVRDPPAPALPAQGLRSCG